MGAQKPIEKEITLTARERAHVYMRGLEAKVRELSEENKALRERLKGVEEVDLEIRTRVSEEVAKRVAIMDALAHLVIQMHRVLDTAPHTYGYISPDEREALRAILTYAKADEVLLASFDQGTR